MGMPPEPETTPSWISTPKLELGSQVPRCVMICTVQLPSNDVRARAVSVAAAAIIATAATAQTVRSHIIFIAANLSRMNMIPTSSWCGVELRSQRILSPKPRELLAWHCRHLFALAAIIESRLDRRGDTSQ
jgi:hypothetical protein